MARFNYGVIVCFSVAFLSLLGCGDPFRTTFQTIVFECRSSASGQPAAGVRVSMWYDYQANNSRLPNMSTGHFIGARFSASTDANGRATVCIRSTAIDHYPWSRVSSRRYTTA
jgi:hypothetical protein